MSVFGDLCIRCMIEKNFMETTMICNLQAHCENNVLWKISKTFQLLATLQKFLSTFYDKFKSIAQNNDVISSFGSICLLLVVVIDAIRKFEIWLKNVLWPSKHGVPLGCTSLVVSQHFSEFLYGIYWWALAPVYVFAGDTVRDLKISLKKCKKSHQVKTV